MNEMASAIRFYYRGEVFESERILKQIITDESNNIHALIRYANILEEIGKEEEAGEVYWKLADIYQSEAGYTDCLEALEKASL